MDFRILLRANPNGNGKIKVLQHREVVGLAGGLGMTTGAIYGEYVDVPVVDEDKESIILGRYHCMSNPELINEISRLKNELVKLEGRNSTLEHDLELALHDKQLSLYYRIKSAIKNSAKGYLSDLAKSKTTTRTF